MPAQRIKDISERRSPHRQPGSGGCLSRRTSRRFGAQTGRDTPTSEADCRVHLQQRPAAICRMTCRGELLRSDQPDLAAQRVRGGPAAATGRTWPRGGGRRWTIDDPVATRPSAAGVQPARRQRRHFTELPDGVTSIAHIGCTGGAPPAGISTVTECSWIGLVMRAHSSTSSTPTSGVGDVHHHLGSRPRPGSGERHCGRSQSRCGFAGLLRGIDHPADDS